MEFIKTAIDIQVKNNLKFIAEFKHRIGEKIWNKMFFVVPTVWAVSKDNVRLELLKTILSPEKYETNVISTEWPRNLDDAMLILKKVISERKLANLTFGASKCPHAKNYQTALGQKTDLLWSDAKEKINVILENKSKP